VHTIWQLQLECPTSEYMPMYLEPVQHSICLVQRVPPTCNKTFKMTTITNTVKAHTYVTVVRHAGNSISRNYNYFKALYFTSTCFNPMKNIFVIQLRYCTVKRTCYHFISKESMLLLSLS